MIVSHDVLRVKQSSHSVEGVDGESMTTRHVQETTESVGKMIRNQQNKDKKRVDHVSYFPETCVLQPDEPDNASKKDTPQEESGL